MKTITDQKYTYQIEGKLLGFLPDSDGKLKYIHVQVGEKILPIKLGKELRDNATKNLFEGDRLLVDLEQTESTLRNKIKLKTTNLTKILAENSEVASLESSSNLSTLNTEKNKKGKILLCSKSSCHKRGGKQLYYFLTETLNQLGLRNQVKIELTGCQKQCKKAPSLVLMPGKIKHTYVNQKELISLLANHYSNPI